MPSSAVNSGHPSSSSYGDIHVDDKVSVVDKTSWRSRFTWRKMLVPTLIVLLVTFGTFNIVSGKIRSQPLGEAAGYVTCIISQYVYFTTYWSLLIILSVLSKLTHKDIMTKEEFLWVWAPRKEADESKKGFLRLWSRLPGIKYTFFSSMGDVLGDNLMYLTQPFLSIILFNLLQQAMVPYTLMWSCILLGRRYISEELLGVCMVVAMTLLSAVVSTGSGGSNSVGMTIVCLLSTLFQALAQVIREAMFLDYARYAEKHDFKNKKLNVFAVGSSNNTFGIIWVFPISILVESFRTSDNVLDAMGEGFQTLLHAKGALPAFVVFMIINVCFNITVFLLISYGSSLLTFVCFKLSVPLSAFLSLVSWPLIGADTISWIEWVCLAVILAGVLIFRHGNGIRFKLEAENERLDETHNKKIPKAIICFWPFFRHRKPVREGEDPNKGVVINTTCCGPHGVPHENRTRTVDVESVLSDIESDGKATEIPLK
ncbi:hypothetical protein Pmar_PMAR006624 [Perkinsus marinus ATCC 50983]|uniref:Chloroquine resistance transporter n=1 Tax=Perkinsus marinus (strain ATCC 50983 / TXsc) TaxID=423536 RepID=C5LLS9_PERM5|nr:hypothetical protein Pmar_PMAR006624 [Perkinsus marinus ATCC 50983]EER02301.1 hypothetical protein Pmar_PMAR006624 [Perkinsus marinus ATCC 50983]|eukprot:XP_002769583.1 hypothetical protein Pmar_PMAR006624 [Perkinsus marinus ATCC 50983]